MKKVRYTILLLFGTTLLQAQIFENTFISQCVANVSVKTITETTYDNWKTIFEYNKEGYILKQINYYKQDIRTNYNFDYVISDTLICIKQSDLKNAEKYYIEKYHIDSVGQDKKYEKYLKSLKLDTLFLIKYDFVFNNRQIISYKETNIFKSEKYAIKTINFLYRDNNLVQMTECNIDTVYHTYLYGKHNHLTDEIVENSNNNDVLDGVPRWNKNRFNKYHIRYENFDKYGNWTKSYYLTEKGKVFRSKRKIEYW